MPLLVPTILVEVANLVQCNVAYLGDLVAVEVEVANLVQCNVAFWGHVLAMAVEQYTLPFCCPQHFLAMLASRQTMAQCQKHPAMAFAGLEPPYLQALVRSSVTTYGTSLAPYPYFFGL